jgi:hypothetical protein
MMVSSQIKKDADIVQYHDASPSSAVIGGRTGRATEGASRL